MQNDVEISRKPDIGKCFNQAFEVYRANAVALIVVSVIYIALSMCSLLFLAGPLWGGYLVMLLRHIRGEEEKVKIGDLFSQMGRFWPLLLLCFLQVVLMIIGGLLLIVPMLFLNCFFLYTELLLIEKDLGVIDSVKASYDLVMQGGLGVNLLIGFSCLALEVVPGMVPYAGWVFSCLTMPLTSLVIVFAYLQQTSEPQQEQVKCLP